MSTISITLRPQTAPNVPRPVTEHAPKLFCFSIEQYDRMVGSGILGKDDRVELIAGMVLEKMAKSPQHVVSVKKTLRELESLLPKGWHIAKEDPIRIPNRDSEPEPDLAVIKGEPEDYLDRNPGATDAGLVVEVAESSIDFDRNVKLSIYGRAAIPFYWIVNLADNQVEVYSEPSGDTEPLGYRKCQVFGLDSEVDLIIEGTILGKISTVNMLP